MIKVIVVDSDESARAQIIAILSREIDIAIVGACACGAEAIEKMEMARPDVLFADADLSDVSGLDLVRWQTTPRPPYLVITATTPKYAVQAWDVNALGYLLKPIDHGRFTTTLAKLRSHITRDRQADNMRNVEVLIAKLNPVEEGSNRTQNVENANERIAIKFGNRYRLVNASAIRHVKAHGTSSAIGMITNETFESTESITKMERKLPPHQFVRINRSIVVNVKNMKSIGLNQSGKVEIRMDNGDIYSVGSTYRERIGRRFANMGALRSRSD